MELIADTTLLIGMWRSQPWARSYMTQNSGKAIGIPWVVFGEFWHGAIIANHDPEQVRRFLTLGLALLDPVPVISTYAEMCTRLQAKKNYGVIGQNDLWIAATALAFDKPLITRNRRHFDKIEGLKIEILAE